MSKDVFNHHQVAIAKKTLRMSDAGAAIMGGMTKDEARAVLRRNGWKQRALDDLESFEFGGIRYKAGSIL